MSLLYRTLVQQGPNIWPEDYVALSRTVSRAPWRILKLFFLKSVIFCIRNGPCSSHAWVWNNSRLRWESKRPPWQLRIGSRARGEIFSVSEHGLKVLDANFYSRTVWNRFQIGVWHWHIKKSRLRALAVDEIDPLAELLYLTRWRVIKVISVVCWSTELSV